MKKTKFFSALTLVLMLLLTLSSCGGGAFLNNINFDYKSDPVYTGATEVTNISGTVAEYGNTLVYLYGTSSNGNGNTHSLYNMDTGNVIFTQQITNAEAAHGKSEEIKIYKIGAQDIYTIKKSNNYEFKSISLHNQNGTPIATSKTESRVEIICNELIVFDNAIYALGKNGFEKTADLDGSFRALPSTRDVDSMHVSKKYVYAIDGYDVTVYTKKGEFIYGYTAPSYAIGVTTMVLDNGKILVQYLNEIIGDGDKFDLIKNGQKYDLVTQIIDPANGKIKNKNVDFLINSISSSYEISLSDNSNFKKDFNGNIAFISPIEKSGYADTTTGKFVELYNDLKIRADLSDVLDYDTGIEHIELVRDGVIVLLDDFDNLVFIKKNGKKLATLKNDYLRYSENFIVTETAIYDYSMKPIYEFKKNDFKFVSLSDTFVILRKNNEYFKFTVGMTEPTSINSMLTGDQYEGTDLGMYCVKRGEQYAYLDATGRTVATFSGKISSSYVTENGNALVKAGGKYYNLSF